MRAQYSDIQNSRTIKFQPYVSIIGIGSLNSDLFETDFEPENVTFADEKLSKILKTDQRRFFDRNEVFENNSRRWHPTEPNYDFSEQTLDFHRSDRLDEPKRNSGPPPGFEPVGSSFFNHIYSSNNNN